MCSYKIGCFATFKPITIKIDNSYSVINDFGRDIFNVAVGIIWQTALAAAPIYLVLKKFNGLTVALIIVGVSSIILRKNWYNRWEE